MLACAHAHTHAHTIHTHFFPCLATEGSDRTVIYCPPFFLFLVKSTLPVTFFLYPSHDSVLVKMLYFIYNFKPFISPLNSSHQGETFMVIFEAVLSTPL